MKGNNIEFDSIFSKFINKKNIFLHFSIYFRIEFLIYLFYNERYESQKGNYSLCVFFSRINNWCWFKTIRESKWEKRIKTYLYIYDHWNRKIFFHHVIGFKLKNTRIKNNLTFCCCCCCWKNKNKRNLNLNKKSIKKKAPILFLIIFFLYHLFSVKFIYFISIFFMDISFYFVSFRLVSAFFLWRISSLDNVIFYTFYIRQYYRRFYFIFS